MANVFVEEASLTAIADMLRTYTKTDQTFRPGEMANGVHTAVQTSAQAAYRTAWDNAIQIGKRLGAEEQYNAFWDVFQANGTRTDYQNGFSGSGWNVDTFKPRHPITPVQSYMMFRQSQIQGDLVAIMEESTGLPWEQCFSTAGLTQAQYMFQSSQFTHIGALDFSHVTDTPSQWFAYATHLETLDKITFNPESTHNFADCFYNCRALKNITVEPLTIGRNGLSFASSPYLTGNSLTSILNGLADKSADTGTAWVLTLGPANLAKLTDAQRQIAADKGWQLA